MCACEGVSVCSLIIVVSNPHLPSDTLISAIDLLTVCDLPENVVADVTEAIVICTRE